MSEIGLIRLLTHTVQRNIIKPIFSKTLRFTVKAQIYANHFIHCVKLGSAEIFDKLLDNPSPTKIALRVQVDPNNFGKLQWQTKLLYQDDTNLNLQPKNFIQLLTTNNSVNNQENVKLAEKTSDISETITSTKEQTVVNATLQVPKPIPVPTPPQTESKTVQSDQEPQRGFQKLTYTPPAAKPLTKSLEIRKKNEDIDTIAEAQIIRKEELTIKPTAIKKQQKQPPPQQLPLQPQQLPLQPQTLPQPQPKPKIQILTFQQYVKKNLPLVKKENIKLSALDAYKLTLANWKTAPENKKNQPSDTKKIRAPLSPGLVLFNLFMKTNTEKSKKLYPHLKPKEIRAMLLAQWKITPDNPKNQKKSKPKKQLSPNVPIKKAKPKIRAVETQKPLSTVQRVVIKNESKLKKKDELKKVNTTSTNKGKKINETII